MLFQAASEQEVTSSFKQSSDSYLVQILSDKPYSLSVIPVLNLDTFPLECSAPQGTILGPVEFIAYTEDVTEIFSLHQVRYHMYADDIQLYYSVSVNDVESARVVVQSCVSDVVNWCAPRRLQLNGDKTELAWFGSRAKLTKLAHSDCSNTIGNIKIEPSSVVRNLGVWLDSELTLKQHVAKIANSCYFQLRRIRQIRRCLGQDAAMQLVSAFVFFPAGLLQWYPRGPAEIICCNVASCPECCCSTGARFCSPVII